MCFLFCDAIFYFLFVWLLVVALEIKTYVVVIISNKAHCLPSSNFQGALSSFFELCFNLFFFFVTLWCWILFFFVWHFLVVTCALVIIFDNVRCLFYRNFQGVPSSFFCSSLFHSSSFVASHCRFFSVVEHWMFSFQWLNMIYVFVNVD
jgi:hypothetical protein